MINCLVPIASYVYLVYTFQLPSYGLIQWKLGVGVNIIVQLSVNAHVQYMLHVHVYMCVCTVH